MSDSLQPDTQAASPNGGHSVVTIRCRMNGPLVVEMSQPSTSEPHAGFIELRVIDHLGQAFPLPTLKRAVALCRCGRTKNRPFCDGTHTITGFEAANLATEIFDA